MSSKRKLSSLSAQVYDSHPSTLPKFSNDAALYNRQPVNACEESEMPERKRMRKESLEKQVEDKATFSGLEILLPGNQHQVQTKAHQSPVSPALVKVDMIVEDYILRYEASKVLGEGRYGVGYEGRRLEDGLKPTSVSEGNHSQEKKSRKSSFDTKGSSGQAQQVQDQTTAPEHERSADDETKQAIITTSHKRKRSSHSVQVYSTPSTSSSSSESEYFLTVSEEDEELERKKKRTVSVEEASSLSFIDRKGIPGQTTAPDYERSADDETKQTIVTTSQKRKRSSHSAQEYKLYDSTLSTSSSSESEYFLTISEEDEGPERKKRTGGVEEGLSLSFFNRKDKTKWTTLTTSQKRKGSSHSAQVYSTPSTSSCSESEYFLCVSEEDEGPERKKKWTDSVEEAFSLSFFDRKGSPCQGQDQTMVPEHERSADDETKQTTLTTSQKRKRSSHSAQVYNLYDNTPSTSSSSESDYFLTISEEDEGPESKKKRMDEAWSFLFFFNRKGSPGHGQAQQVQEQADVPLYRRDAEKPSLLQDINCAVADGGLQKPNFNQQSILTRYKVGRMLGEGGYGAVYEGKRLEDGLEVAIKFAKKTKNMVCINTPGHPTPLPLEVSLLLLVNKDPKVPQIIDLLDWQDLPDQYIMVLERPSPCEDLFDYVDRCGGTLNEDIARLVMWQATYAAYMCCQRGVFHRDIKLDNLLINPETLEVKLIDFGCGDLMRESGYDIFWGTDEYFPPEYNMDGRYHGKSATVWSLGVVLFVMLCGRFPKKKDLLEIGWDKWFEPDLSDDCCHLIRRLLQQDPSRRIGLDEILLHSWFKILPNLPSADVNGQPSMP